MADVSPESVALPQAAEELSQTHRISTDSPRPIPAWSQVRAVVQWLHDARLACTTAAPEASKAAEWLLDNDYQVHRALRQIEQDLPASFYGRLPALADDKEAALPRVFVLAHHLLRLTRMQISSGTLVRFLRSYQRQSPLSIAELWAFPTMLRIACVEILVSTLTQIFCDCLTMPFRPSRWATEPHSLEATEQVGRAIANLGLIEAISWEDFFDQVSCVEEILRTDPSGFYERMDFQSRDRYRRVVEDLARHAAKGEVEVAASAVDAAQSARADLPQGHVGYWLVGDGCAAFQRQLGTRLPLAQRWRNAALQNPGLFYFSALAVFWAGALLLPASYLWWIDSQLPGWLGGLSLALIPASVLAITLLHWAITRIFPPRVLNKLDCSEGLPQDCPTLIVIPVIVARTNEVPSLVEQMETHWLSNLDPMLQVVLLADLADASTEHTALDGDIERALKERVRELNARHSHAGAGPFHLLLRPRRYNAAEGCWLAWERKRGKLEQFNRMLVEGDSSAFPLHVGDRPIPKGVRFVVTVDGDTILPPGSVSRLVGTLAHPLNRAQIDPATGAITSGYSIIQPRVEISPQSGSRTLFARLFTGDTSIDIYSRAVSDVYQDLFGAGIFVGKGIYDVEAFHRSVDARVPENSILSHDLFEGAHGRVALATDIVLYEGFPRSYLEYARRLHRWLRGDWQLLPWLAPKVPAADGTKVANRLSSIDRWKIADNLRRSLVAPATFLLAVAGWLVLPGQAWFWTLLVFFTPAGQLFADLVSGLARGQRRGSAHGLLPQLHDQAGRWLLAIVYLPHEALLSLRAIGLTLWRLLITRRKLLEWTTAAHEAARLHKHHTRAGIWRQMWPGPAISIGLAVALSAMRPGALLTALPLLIIWILAPEVTLFIGRLRKEEAEPLTRGDVTFLRMLARRTWFYFETFAGPEDNWLPPDNYQGAPHEDIAHRTSPTNIGMLLLATATAWDLGYLGRTELAARTANLFDSLARMERYRGHFYNWYDTRTLAPLEPHYVSTVDSGNLAVCLVAYAAALRTASEDSRLESQRWEGLSDVLDLLDETAEAWNGEALRQWTSDLRARIISLKQTPENWTNGLRELCETRIPQLEHALAEAVNSAASPPIDLLRDLHGFLDRLRYQSRSMWNDAETGSTSASDLIRLADQAREFAYAMEFKPLYDEERRLFQIGYNVSSGRADTHYYDLLASEARLASFFAIAKGDVPVEHWFHLGRALTRADGGLLLISWNGSMFEYLMPRLLLRSRIDTLLGESERRAVEIQRRYGESHRLPWGISESAYSARDPEHHYRYQAFGVPALGLKRGLGRDMVIAPYASALGLPIAPTHAVANLKELARLGACGRYGLFEALDFTSDRVSQGKFTAVHAYMAHHQGMILSSIGNVLLSDIFVQRFTADPRTRTVSLLLSERVPREIPAEIERLEERDRPLGRGAPLRIPAAWTPPPATAFPQVHLLGNGPLSSWISEAGGGGLRWHHNALTRFVADGTRDANGYWIYVADDESGALWSAARQPTGMQPDEYRVTFHPHMAEFHRRDHGIALNLEVAVIAGDDLEVRRLTLVNEGAHPRTLRLTSYGEVVLGAPMDDERHPAFSKLFVGSEYIAHLGGLLFRRRPRAPHETPPLLLHFAVDAQGPIQPLGYESDRSRFVGRNGHLRFPPGARMDLSNTSGWTLDPIMALQLGVTLQPYETRELCFLTVAAATRERAVDLAERYSTLAAVNWALPDALGESARALEHAQIEPASLPALQALASLLVYPHGSLRGNAAAFSGNRLGQPHLWGMALSGDLPILLLRTAGTGGLLAQQLIGGHQLWRRHGLQVDLVILQTGGSAYVEPIRDDVVALLRQTGATEMLGRKGGVHLLFRDQIGSDQVRLLESVARVVVDEARGTLEDQLSQAFEPPSQLPRFSAALPPDRKAADALERPKELRFDNGLGGFTPDGREYVIHLEPGEATPAPWCNVLANDEFGCLVSEAGGGFSWAVNSGENRLTSWTNDPVSDPPVETLYLRDEETASVWTVTPAPAGHSSACQVRHGAGYTRWSQKSHGLDQEMLMFVPLDAPVKIVRLRLRNLENRHRRLTSTYYAEWLLGALPSIARPHVVCDYDPAAQAILAMSRWNEDFAERVAFLTASRPPHGFTTDRREFLGREGDPSDPAALGRWGLSGKLVAGGDPCAAYQVHLEFAPGASEEIIFVLGQGADHTLARELARRWSEPHLVEQALQALEHHWNGILGAVEISTPDPAFDLMVNRWLIYQSLSSRVLARTGFYQSSGAIGFRDQLQDVLALLHTEPARTRAHILQCARHQFTEGDVLHWWHPPSDRGVRTRCSDDLIWLPYAVGTYVQATGDLTILDEEIPFLDAPPLKPEEENRYARFDMAGILRPLIDHCERALEHGLTAGPNGLPLMGAGDWNDGMDRVGREGRGESIWLAWFGSVTADLFADVSRRAEREMSASRWTERARELRQRAEEAGWDGAWYRRAYDDEGHPLGSASNDECRIDSISQSWAAFAGAEPGRVRQALDAAWRELVSPEHKLARLLWPAFDKGARDPGYIKAYPPGIRENGGQYSHAAAWLGMAFAQQGEPDKAFAIFDMINPVRRSDEKAKAKRYALEPYVVAGDIAAADPHSGRGGWSWYTGAAGWAWRLAAEGILGLRLVDGRLTIAPSIPPSWGGFRAVLRGPTGTISVQVEDPDHLGRGNVELTVNGARLTTGGISFPTDGAEIEVRVRLTP